MEKKPKVITLKGKKFDYILRERLIEDADEIERTLDADPEFNKIEAPADVLDKITASLKKQGYLEDD